MSRYIIKVKKSDDKTYLWGGKDIKVDISSPLFFTFRVMDTGEKIKVWTESKAEGLNEIGSLKENESFTVHLNKISGIYAICEVNGKRVDTKVECFIESFGESN